MGNAIFCLGFGFGIAAVIWWWVGRAIRLGAIETSYGVRQAKTDPIAFRRWIIGFSVAACLLSLMGVAGVVMIAIPSTSDPIMGSIGMIVFFAIPFGCIWLVVDALRRGVVLAKGATYTRNENPIAYWILVMIYSGLATFFLALIGRAALDALVRP